MSWYPLFCHNKLYGDCSPSSFKVESVEQAKDDLENILSSLRYHQALIRNKNVGQILDVFDEFRSILSNRNYNLNRELRPFGLPYVLEWIRRENLERLINLSLKGDGTFLDKFLPFPLRENGKVMLRAHPRGLVVHWLSGNVPMLGFFSLVQALLTKNASILKVARNETGALPLLVHLLSKVDKEIAQSIAIIYLDQDDMTNQRKLSLSADVRIAWGGKEAVSTIQMLPKRDGAEDLFFGPKYSYMVIGKDVLKKESVEKIARNVALDASAFDQQGCNSPHTVFVEQGGEVSPSEFAAKLAKAMEDVARFFPQGARSEGEAIKVHNVRAEYGMRGEAYHPKNLAWSVLYAENDDGLAEPCFCRTLFVRPISNVMEAAKYANTKTQSIGVALNFDRRIEFVEKATAMGADRCPPVGKMSDYEAPWDGLFMLDRLVRWVSVSCEDQNYL